MKYIDQSHKELRIYLLEDKVPKDKFSIVSKSNFTDRDTIVEFGILSESHFVTIKNNKYTFSEICACTDTIIPGSDTDFLTDIGEMSKIITYKNVNYTFTQQVNNYSVGAMRLTALQSKRTHPHCYYLEHIFPTCEPGEISPVTEIYVTMGDQILIESVHSYPNENVMVFTISTLEKNTDKTKLNP